MSVAWLQFYVTLGLLIFGIVAWGEKYFRGNEREDAESWATQKQWNQATDLTLKAILFRLDRANEEMSKMTTSWMGKVAQLDEHHRAADLKSITLETIVSGMRDQIRQTDTHLREIEQHGCVYGQENRKQIDDLSRRHRP